MSDAAPAPRQYQMSPRARRRFLIGLALTCLALFVAGMLAFLLDFRHRTICPGGAAWIAQSQDEFGQVTYTCPGGKTVQPSIVP
jgi:hypothetical protein